MFNNQKSTFSEIIKTIKEDRFTQVFILMLIFGGIIRYYGITNAENTDEYNEVFEALRVASGKFNFNRWFKKGYQNILAIEYGFYFIIGYLLNIFSSPMDFAAKVVRNMEPLFLIGRYTTATLGTLSIGLVYLIGRKLYNGRVGLLAALLLTVNSIHVWTSHLVNTDVPLLFFFLLSFYFICRFYETGMLSDYIYAAMFGAIAINVKTMGIGIGIVFVLGHIIRCINEKRRYINYVFCREMMWSFVAFIAAFALSNPPIIIGIKQFIVYHLQVYTNVYDEVPYAIDDNGYYTYLLILYNEMGVPLFLSIIAGLGYALYKRENWDIILLIFIIGMYCLLSGTTFLIQDRYLMVIFPALYLLTGRMVDSFLTRYASLAKRKAPALLIISIILCIHPAVTSLKYVRTLTEKNTSIISKRWIEENIPAGSKILIDAGHTMITSGPRISQSWERLEAQLNIIKDLKEGETYDSRYVRIVDSYSSIYFELLLQNMPEITYNITTTELGRQLESVEYYKENGFDYFIHNEDMIYRIDDPLWRDKYPKSAQFYDSFKHSYTLIKSFDPSPTRSGPDIKIYKINQL